MKVSLSTKTIYVKHTCNGHAGLEPSLGVSLPPNDVTIGDLLGQENSLEVWVAYFESLEAEKVWSTSPLATNALSPWEEMELIAWTSYSPVRMPQHLQLHFSTQSNELPNLSNDFTVT
jgi:hypothetical protein